MHSYGRNIIVSNMGKVESRSEAEFYIPFLQEYCIQHDLTLIRPPPFDMDPLLPPQAANDAKSILSLVPHRRPVRPPPLLPCCAPGEVVADVTSETLSPNELATDVPDASASVTSDIDIDDYEVVQSDVQEQRFKQYCCKPWFPIDFCKSPLFEGVGSTQANIKGASLVCCYAIKKMEPFYLASSLAGRLCQT